MAITAGSDGLAADFITTSGGAGDSGRVPKLDANGKLDNSFLANAFTTSEAVTAGDAVCIGDGTAHSYTTTGTGSVTGITNTQWLSQSFATKTTAVSIQQVNLTLNKASGSASHTITVSIRANSAGSPTGADLGSVSVSCALTTTLTSFGFTFSSPITVSPSTTYHVLVRDGAASNAQVSRGNTAGQGTNISTNSGSTWAANNGPFDAMVIYEIDTTAGQIARTTADTSLTGGARNNNFVGFAYETKSAGQSCRVSYSPLATGLSGLTAGSTYYLSNTLGALSTSAGAISRKIGIALAATLLLIKNDNP
jgi:hypothetical protein